MRTFAVVLATIAALAQPPGPGHVQFYWCALANLGTTSVPRYAILKDDEVPSMKPGNRLQFYLAPVDAVHAYLLRVRTDGAVERIFPDAGGSAEIAAGEPKYFPRKGGWLDVDAREGRERVVLIVSTAALPQLEHALADGGRAAVDAEITRLREAYPMTPAPTVRPRTIAGTFRAATPDPASYAHEVNGPQVFTQTYIIEHK